MSTWAKLVDGLKDIAPMVAGAAGTAAGGPLVGGALAALARKMTGAAAGTSLDDVAASILADPNKALEFRLEAQKIEADLEKARMAHRAALRLQDSADLTTVNGTMQAESTSEHWAQWGWRPFWGFISGSAFLVVCILVCLLGYRAIVEKDTEALRMIPDLVTAMSLLFATPLTILGVASHHRGKAKVEAAKVGRGKLVAPAELSR